MKKIILLAFVALGCNTITKEEAHKITTEYIKDYVFKEKCEINIHKMDIVELKPTDSKTLDSAEIAMKKNLYWYVNNEMNKQKQIINELEILPIDFEIMSTTKRSKAELDEEMAKILEMQSFYKKQHEEDLEKIKNRKTQPKITHAKVLLKATVGCHNTKNQYFDTLNVFIDQNKKIIPSDILYLHLTVYDTKLL